MKSKNAVMMSHYNGFPAVHSCNEKNGQNDERIMATFATTIELCKN